MIRYTVDGSDPTQGGHIRYGGEYFAPEQIDQLRVAEQKPDGTWKELTVGVLEPTKEPKT